MTDNFLLNDNCLLSDLVFVEQSLLVCLTIICLLHYNPFLLLYNFLSFCCIGKSRPRRSHEMFYKHRCVLLLHSLISWVVIFLKQFGNALQPKRFELINRIWGSASVIQVYLDFSLFICTFCYKVIIFSLEITIYIYILHTLVLYLNSHDVTDPPCAYFALLQNTYFPTLSLS